jgi:four helix bundle protein
MRVAGERCRDAGGFREPFVMSDFKKLETWRKAHALALNVHRAAIRIRSSGSSALRNQMMRAAMSIPTNLVEGTGQRTAREYARFVRIAINSASELEYHLIVAREIKALNAKEIDSLSADTIQVRRMLYGLLRRLSTNAYRSPAKTAKPDGPPAVTR